MPASKAFVRLFPPLFSALSLVTVLFPAAAAPVPTAVCATCHPKEAAGYARSAMARSLGLPADQPSGAFTHEPSGARFTIETNASGMWQSYTRGDESSRQRVAYVIGSGNHAFGYLIEIAGHLFQSPLSYYTSRRAWDVAPGYEQSPAPDFGRPVTSECLLCHSGAARPVANTLNEFETPPFAAEAITCDRCHGDVSAHLKAPSARNIVNPARLSGAIRDSICEQCHLAGEIRIPNPGRSLADFRPGQALEDSYSVYVAPRKTDAGLKVVSHAEQLALSVCARKSGGKLWCGSCHDPHNPPSQPAPYYREKCLACHGATLAAGHAAPGRDCVACHMPTASAFDGGHTAFTDHRIRRRPDAGVALVSGLTAWREPASGLRERDLALALVTNGLENSSAADVIRGYKLMNRIAASFPDDPAFLTSLGSVLLKGREPAEALRRFQRAQSLRPNYAPYEVNVAAALIDLTQVDAAVIHLERACRLDPLLREAVEALARAYRAVNQPSRADEVLRQYREVSGIRYFPNQANKTVH